MKLGTPGFNGERLRQAREARGITAISLADTAGVSRQAISQYEKGASTPSPAVVEKLAEKLSVPVRFFRLPSVEPEAGAIFYRSMSAATKSSRQRAEQRFAWLQEIIWYVGGFVELPKVNFPDLDVSPDPERIAMVDIEGFAFRCRRFWGLQDGPISNVAWLAENNGVVVTRHELGAETIDAFSLWSSIDARPYIVLGTEKASAVRSRYDCAHELGHLIMHRNVARSRLRDASDYRRLEDQAHRFASAFLLPANTFSDDFYVPTLASLRALKHKWHVSMGAMIKRARQLDLIGADQERRLWINYSRQGYRTCEPLDDQLEAEEPRLLRKAVDLILDHRLQQRMTFVHSVAPFQAFDIEALIGLPRGYLSDEDDDAPVRLLPDRGSVIEFRRAN